MTMLQEAEADRVRAGANPRTDAAAFAALASDESVRVRATLAMNPAVPPETDRKLSRDRDARVRELVARKLSAALCERPEAMQVLCDLVSDVAKSVRVTVAQALRDRADAPRPAILSLAWDKEETVAEPVILSSPVLTENDLVDLVRGAPTTSAATAVANRATVQETVSDAIAASADPRAIQALLENPSAQIREAALDALAASASAGSAWSSALASRQSQMRASPKTSPVETCMREARKLADAGLLTEQAFLAAVRNGDDTLSKAILAVAADVRFATVEQAASLRSSRGLISLTWSAGFSMRAATAAQSALGSLAPGEVLGAAPGGGFPMSPEEMRWQLSFLGGDWRN